MKTFNKPKPVQDIKPLKKNRHLKLKLGVSTVMLGFICLFFGLFLMLAKEYKDTHSFKFRSPIIVQKPLIIKREMTIISPMSTQSGSMNIAYAAEIENPYDVKSPKGIAWELVKNKWGVQEWGAFEELVMRESGWRPYAINSSSSACGLPQALPCEKMGVELWDYEGQLNWMINYVENRYSTPTKAIQFHDRQKEETGAGWY